MIKLMLKMIAGFTAALSLSGCFIERVNTPTAVYPNYDYDYESDYGSSSYGGYGYTTPSPLPSLAPVDSGNRRPILQGIAANPGFRVRPGQMVTFTVSAQDPDHDPLQMTWATTDGVLSADSGRIVTWMAPRQAGVYSVQVHLSDDRGGTVAGAQNIVVEEAPVVAPPQPLPTPGVVAVKSPEPTPTPTPRPSSTPRATSTPMPVMTPSPLPEEWVWDEDETEETEL